MKSNPDEQVFICDVTGCGVEAVRCSVGEAGDFWFCEEHWKEATGG